MTPLNPFTYKFLNAQQGDLKDFKQPREMLWGGRWEGGSCLGTHVRIKDFKI